MMKMKKKKMMMMISITLIRIGSSMLFLGSGPEVPTRSSRG